MLALDVSLGGHTRHLLTQLEFAKVSVVAQGPLGASVRVEVVYGQSRISVTVRGFAVVRASVLLADSMRCRSRLTLSQVRCVFSSPEESIAHYPALVSTKLNLRSMFCFDAWVDWRQRTPTQWKAELCSWRVVILNLMHDCFADLDFPLSSTTAALQNFAAVRPLTRRAQASS
jgi:hypothetical protein